MKRTLFIRIGFVLILVLIGVLMFFIGKGHTIIIDNRSVGEINALSVAYFSIDGGDELEMPRRMRDQVEVTGQSHKIKVTYTDSSFKEQTIEKKVKLPLNDTMMILSIPTLVNDPSAPQETWLYHFVSEATTVDDANLTNEVVTDDMAFDF